MSCWSTGVTAPEVIGTRVPVRAPAPAVGVLRRQLADPRERHDRQTGPNVASTNGRRRRRSAITTSGCSGAPPRVGPGPLLRDERLRRGGRTSIGSCPGSRARRPPCGCGAGSSMPGPGDPGAVDAYAVFRAEPGARFIPVNDLVAMTDRPGVHRDRRRQDRAWTRACGCSTRRAARCHPVDPPRDAWLLDREYQQPLERLPMLMEGVSLYIEAAAAAESVAISLRGSKRADNSCASTQRSSPRCTGVRR